MQVCSEDRCNQGRKRCPCPDKCRDESDPIAWLEDFRPWAWAIGLLMVLVFVLSMTFAKWVMK